MYAPSHNFGRASHCCCHFNMHHVSDAMLSASIFMLTTTRLKWRLGAWDIKELPLLVDSSYMKTAPTHGWQILATQLWAPLQEQAPITLLRQWKEGGKGDTTKMPEKRLIYVCHATIHKQVEFRHMHMRLHRWLPGKRKSSLLLTPLNCI